MLLPLPREVYDLLCNWSSEPANPWPVDADFDGSEMETDDGNF